MRIIQIGNYPLDPDTIRGGVEASIYGIAQAMAKQNTVEIISEPDKSLEEDKVITHKNIHIHYLANPYRFISLSFLRIGTFCSLIQKFKADVVHIHKTSLLYLLLILYLRWKKINTVITIHGICYIEMWKNFKRAKSISSFLKYLIYSFFEYLTLWLAPQIIIDTPYVAEALSKIKKRKYHVIPQGIDDVYFTMNDQCRKDQMVSIGSISSRKGHDYLIRSIAILKNEFPDIKLQIIGVVFPENQKYYVSLLELIRINHLEENVTVLTDFPADKLRQVLSEAYLFVLHSYEESQGIALCEAMAAGKPAIATRVGGIPYVIQDEINGLLSAFGDVDHFVKNIREILLNLDRRNAMGNESRKLAQQYSWDAIATKVKEVYYGKKAIKFLFDKHPYSSSQPFF